MCRGCVPVRWRAGEPSLPGSIEGVSLWGDGRESPPYAAPEAARSLCLAAAHLAGRQGNCPAASASEVRFRKPARSVREGGAGLLLLRCLSVWKGPSSLHVHRASYIIDNRKAHAGASLSKLKTFLENLPTLHILLLLHFALRCTQFSSAAQPCPTLCDPMDCSTPGLPVHHQLPELAQTHVRRVGDAIQPSRPLSSPARILLRTWKGEMPGDAGAYGGDKSTLPSVIPWQCVQPRLPGRVLSSKAVIKGNKPHGCFWNSLPEPFKNWAHATEGDKNAWQQETWSPGWLPSSSEWLAWEVGHSTVRFWEIQTEAGSSPKERKKNKPKNIEPNHKQPRKQMPMRERLQGSLYISTYIHSDNKRPKATCLFISAGKHSCQTWRRWQARTRTTELLKWARLPVPCKYTPVLILISNMCFLDAQNV